MSSDISGTRMAIDFRNISSNQTDATNKRTAPDSATNQQQEAPAQVSTSSQDTVVLSDKAQVVQSLISEISEPPKTDPARIEALRSAIDSGTYTVSAENIASKLLTIDFGIRNQDE